VTRLHFSPFGLVFSVVQFDLNCIRRFLGGLWAILFENHQVTLIIAFLCLTFSDRRGRSRVARLGELVITSSPNFGLLFPRKKLYINLDKNGLGYILGNCFTNSFGHLGGRGWEEVGNIKSTFYICRYVRPMI
jgi:hypothetical protein